MALAISLLDQDVWAAYLAAAMSNKQVNGLP